MDLDKKAIGDAIKKNRQKKGLTQEKLAELLDIAPMYIKHLESGRRTPSVDTLYKTARLLNISIDAIFFPENTETSEMRSKIVRKLSDLTAHELNIIHSTIEAMENKENE